MGHGQSHLQPVIDPWRYGVSFSLKQCRNFGLDPHDVLKWLIGQGWRRFRLMSYWDEHEKQQGIYDFSELDWQVNVIERTKAKFSLCLGVKQPRWPEYHWPEWALDLAKTERDQSLFKYIEQVVQRYKGSTALTLYQLENEALLKGFGNDIEIDRHRLRKEYALVRKLDGARLIVMSTSNGWGIPLRAPRPDAVGFSYYPIIYKDGRYRATIQKPRFHKLRKAIIQGLWSRPVFIHELQCEPWGPTAIWKMDQTEQDKSMNPEQIRRNVTGAKQIGAYPIDLWGAEWWYWRHLHGDDIIHQTIEGIL